MIDLLALWNFDDPKASEVRFRDAAAACPEGSAERLEVATQIARALGLQREFDAAHRVLDGVAEALSKDAKADRVVVRYLLERGRVFNSSGDAAQAKPLFVEAFDRAMLAKEDDLAVDAAHMVAIVESPERQMAWNERALAVSQSSPDSQARRWRASLLNNMGWTRHGEGAFTAALELFEQALEARLEQGDAASIRIARWCVARCLRSLDRLDEALVVQQQLARELAAAKETDGYVEEELGECLLALGRAAEAKPHFARAAEQLGADPWFVANEAQRLERLRSLGGVP